MVRLGSGRFGVGFWVGFWVGLRARDFPTERVLSRTPLIIRTVDHFLLIVSRFQLLIIDTPLPFSFIGAVWGPWINPATRYARSPVTLAL